MKRSYSLAAFAAGLAAAALFSGCAGETTVNNQPVETSGITVSGTGQVQVPPDLGFVNVGIQVTATTVEQARDDAADAADAVIKSIKSNGVADKDIKTTGLSIQPNYDYRTSGAVLTGYTVTNTVKATVRDVEDMSKVVDGAVTAGGNAARLQSISFGIEDESKPMQEAREKAMADAKAKAEQLAKLGDVSLGAPVTISETQTSGGGIKQDAAGRDDDGGSVPTPIEVGTNTVTVNVTVRWAIQ